MKDRKGLAVLIASKIPPPGKRKAAGSKPAEDEDTDDEDGDAGLESAAADVRAALKGSDDAELAQALKAFYELCTE
jgi:hypothetical protein